MNVAILHEGNAGKSEDNKLLKALLRAQSLDESRVLFYGMGSKNNFVNYGYKDYQELIQLIQADQIERVLFTADADSQGSDQKHGGYENSVDMLKNVASHFEISAISQFHVFCDPMTQQGNVESFLLATLSSEKKSCINNFMECSGFKGKENSKAVLKGIYNIAFAEPPYHFEHEYFDELKKKLVNLFR